MFSKAIGREEAKNVCVYVVLYNTYNYYQLYNSTYIIIIIYLENMSISDSFAASLSICPTVVILFHGQPYLDKFS